MRLIGWTLGNLGNTDRSLSAAAVVIPATVTVIKNVSPIDNGSLWDFILTGPDSFSENATDIGDEDSYLFNNLNPGTGYVLSETTNSNYDTSVECTLDGQSFASGSDSVSLDLGEDEDVICTFTNTIHNGSITVEKVTNPSGVEQTFDFTLGGDADGETTLGDGESYTFSDLLPGTYSLTEGESVFGWDLTGAVCSDESNPSSIDLSAGEDITCTFTNERLPLLTVIKSVTNDNGGDAVVEDFSLSVDETPVLSGETNVFEPGTYLVGEIGLDGYLLTSISGDCGSGGSITLGYGDDASCTLVNDDQPASITLIKSVTNDNGGDAGVNDFGLTIGGDSVTSGETVEVNANTSYALDEAGLSGYEFVSITGDEGCPSELGGMVTLNEGESITCTITNDDVAPTITLIKSMVNDDGGTAGPDDFGISVGGDGVLSGSTTSVDANTSIAIDEEGLSGYSFVSISGEGCPEELGGTVTLNEGEDITCTIINDDIAPTLRLVKNVENDNGGDAVSADWTMTAGGGEDGFSDGGNSEEFHPITAGTTYTLSEDGPSGYTAGDWSCDGGSLEGNQVMLGLDEDVTCEITNDDVAPTITLIKSVTNDNGGDAGENDFGLTVGGTPVDSGQTLEVDANEFYALDEAGLFGYSFVSLTGDEGCPQTLGGTVTLNEGESITCTITNDDIAPTLIVVKTVINDGIGADNPLSSSDFTMSVSGTNVSLPSFPGSDTPGTTVTLNAGTFSVGEDGSPLYAATFIGDCEGEIAVGEVKTCVVTNDDGDVLGEETKKGEVLPATGANPLGIAIAASALMVGIILRRKSARPAKQKA